MPTSVRCTDRERAPSGLSPPGMLLKSTLRVERPTPMPPKDPPSLPSTHPPTAEAPAFLVVQKHQHQQQQQEGEQGKTAHACSRVVQFPPLAPLLCASCSPPASLSLSGLPWECCVLQVSWGLRWETKEGAGQLGASSFATGVWQGRSVPAPALLGKQALLLARQA